MKTIRRTATLALLFALTPTLAMAYGFAINLPQNPVQNMESFEIEVHNSAGQLISPDCLEPWDCDWTCSVQDHGAGVGVVSFTGTPLDSPYTQVFCIMDNATSGTFSTHRATWIKGGTDYPVALPVQLFEVSGAGDQVTVTILNDSASDIMLGALHYKIVPQPYDIDELTGASNLTWVPDYVNYTLEPSEEVSFDIAIGSTSVYVIVKLQASWADEPGVWETSWTQLRASEMPTPVARSTWSEVKRDYE